MAGAVVAPDFGTWTAPEHSIRIEYSAEVASQIRIAAVDGYLRVRHGGLETGGILFGTHEQDTVRILAWRPIVCEYARGPSFLLSETDEAALAEALRSWRSDPELAALEPVGWYHSHTRSDIFLSEQDLEFFNRFFPEPWQVALVVRPASFALVRAGFFFREAEGRVHAESSYCEFPLTAQRAAGAAIGPPPEEFVAPSNGAGGETLPVVIEPAVEIKPALAPRASRWKWYVAVLIVLAAAAIAIWQWPTPPPRLALTATDAGGALRIGWDRAAGPVRDAARAVIEIEDHGVRTVLKLTPADLAIGNIAYARQSGDVAVRLRVQPAQGPPVEEAVRFLKPDAPGPAAPPQPQPDLGKQELEREAEAMRAQLEQQNAELSKLQQMVHPDKAAAPRAPAPAPARTRPAAPAKQPEPLAAAPVVVAPPKIEAPPPAITRAEPPPQKAAVLPASPPPAPPRASVAEQPAAGRLIWTGKLPKSGALIIEGNYASTGVLGGKLPARAVHVSAYPGELTAQGMTIFTPDAKYTHPRVEAASEQNGWNRTTYTYDPKRAAAIRITEQPSPQNSYHLVLQNESGKAPVVIIEWRAQ